MRRHITENDLASGDSGQRVVFSAKSRRPVPHQQPANSFDADGEFFAGESARSRFAAALCNRRRGTGRGDVL
jgi:hypothetical protein